MVGWAGPASLLWVSKWTQPCSPSHCRALDRRFVCHTYGVIETHRSVHCMSEVPGFQHSRQLPALATTQAWPQPQRLTQWGLRASGVALARVRVSAVTAGGRRRKEETQGPSGRWSKYQLGPSWKLWLLQEDRDPAARRGTGGSCSRCDARAHEPSTCTRS